MAGTQEIGESSDNPVGINVTAMVDVIFCLCLFFMCSFHFKQLEGKLETWMPKSGSSAAVKAPAEQIALEEIRIVLRWDPDAKATLRQIGNRPPTTDDTTLMKAVLSMRDDFLRAQRLDFPVLLDPARDVPWRDVVRVMDLCKAEKLDRIEFVGRADKEPRKS